MKELIVILVIMGVSIGGVIFSFLVARWILKHDTGTPEMRAISDAIKEGAEAFLRRQYKTIIYISIPFAIALFVGYGIIRGHKPFDPVSSAIELAFWIALSFVAGAISSLIAGYVGMWASIRSNIRVAAAAARKSLPDALKIALRGGAVSGTMVVSMSLLGIGGLYILMKLFSTAEPIKIPLLIVGYGFGASFVALFAQLGGGIYTKAADVGADLVGKVEAGIPEDDPRNPAVIADQVGDNVGDCAGRGADLFESTAAENIGAMILGAAMASKVAGAEAAWVFGVMMFPLVARAFGIISSIIGIMMVNAKSNDDDPMRALNKGYYLSVVLAMIGFAIASRWLLHHPNYPSAWINFFLCGVVGVLTSVAFVFITQYYTEDRYRPVKEIVRSSQTGPATNIITGLAVGLENTALPAITIGIAILISYYLGRATGLPDAGLFGTAVATMGMLSTAGFILAMDTFGPITDNAGGIAEMSHQPKDVRQITDKLDAVGNTTKALTKGYAIGSAGLAAFLLFSAYLDEVRNYGVDLKSVDIAKPEVFVAGLIGAMLVFLFSGLAIRAVGRAAYYVINEVRRQFREKPGILQGTEKPEYGTCVDIVTRGALKEMIIPGLLPVIVPTLVGIIFKVIGMGAETVAAVLMIGTISGILVATVFNNGGAAWDNAKKSIELSGAKGTEAHKAAVVGDTVGDPLKDTAGPSLHVLVKLLSTVTLVLAPLFI